MSMSSRKKKALFLRQLHLTPNIIYLVNNKDYAEGVSYTLQLWKDERRVTNTESFIKSPPTHHNKYSTIQFRGIKFLFDVEALFHEQSSATIQLKLRQQNGNQQSIMDQFELHLLYYNFQFSKDKFVKRRQNSTGKINNNIFNYSFSALYGQPLTGVLFKKQSHQKRDILLEDIYLDKKVLKYGELEQQQKKNAPLSTIFLLEAVTQSGIAKQKNNFDFLGSLMETSSKLDNLSTNLQIPNDSEVQSEDARKAARSIVDETPFQTWDSNIIDHELVEQMIGIGKDVFSWVLIILSSILIYMLMHPIKKI